MSPAGTLPVNWRAALREPGLRLLFAAVLIAVAALSSVAFFADRVERALVLQEGFSTLEPRLGPFAPGVYRVLATSEDGRTASAQVSIAGEPLRRVELRLE